MTTKYRLGNTILIGSGHILYSIGKNCEDGDYYLFVTHRLRHRGFVYNTTVQVYTASQMVCTARTEAVQGVHMYCGEPVTSLVSASSDINRQTESS